MQRFSTLLFSLLLIFTFSACDSDEDGNGDGNGNGNVDAGEFSSTLGGDLDGSFSGNAFFAVVEDDSYPGGRAFVLFMTDADLDAGDTQFTQYIAFIRFSDLPGDGTYTLADVEDGNPNIEGATYGIYANLTSQTSGQFLVSQSGTLRISDSSSDEIRGSFDFEGVGFNTSTNQEANGSISGSFAAMRISDDVIIVPENP